MKKVKLLKTNWKIDNTKVWLCIVFCFPFFLNAQNQDSTFTLIHEIKVEATQITTDKLQNIYAITSKNELVKYNPLGVELFRYNNNTFGHLSHVDVTDPFNLLLYYPAYLTILTLNRTLSKTGQFDLSNLDVLEVQTIAMSNDNNVWLYDDVEFKLKKINHKGETLLESDDLTMVLDEELNPNFIIERDNRVFVNDPNVGILLFDNFGRFSHLLDIKNLNSFQVFKDKIFYQSSSEINVYSLSSLRTQKILFPKLVEKGKMICIQKNSFYILQNNAIKIYSF